MAKTLKVVSGSSVVKLMIWFSMVSYSLVGFYANAAIDKKLIEFWDDYEESSLINLDHSAFEQILQKYVVPEHPSGIARFDYQSFTESDLVKLNEYLNYLQFMEPRQLSQPEAKAFWLNLHNAATLKLVVETLVDGTITKIKGRGLSARSWRRNIVTIAEQKLSLNDILNGVLRPMYNDPRIHYGVFFCTLGGPDMPTEVFNGENNEELLDRLEAAYLAQSRAVRVEAGEIVLSEMFEDYAIDFADSQLGLIDYLKEHTPAAVAESLNPAMEIRFEYDWSLNDL